MGKYEPCYLKSVVIVHGKSEKQICEYIKTNLRMKIEIVSDKKGEKSIQITGLKNILNNTVFGKYDSFIKKYDDVKLVKKGKKTQIDSSFKIFIIMDTDDCTETQKTQFITKEMFKNHWAYEYIVPIYDSPDLESVLVKAKIKFEKKGIERKKEYIKIFPTEQKYITRETVELEKFCSDLAKVKETNMEEFVEFCLTCQ